MDEGFIIQQNMAKSQAELIIKTAGLSFIKPKFFKVDEALISTEKDAIDTAILESDGASMLDSKSKFGLPMFDTVRFENLRYTTNDGKAANYPTFDMGTALCEVRQTRNIVSTQIQGRNGTVKEYISDGDFDITIKGVLCSLYQNVPPKDALANLLGFCKAPIEFNVSSNFLTYFGIYTIVVKDYYFEQREGERNVIPFQLFCYSDIPVEVKYKNSKVPSRTI